MRHRLAPALALAACLGTVLAAAPRFTSTWKAPEAAGVSFAARKVAALVISQDENLRVSSEEALVRELVAIGIKDAVAAYRLVPREELKDAAKAKPWFERAGVEGVVTLRLVRAETEQAYTPSYWASPVLHLALGLLRVRLGRRLRIRIVARRHHPSRREPGFQRLEGQAAVGRRQRNDEPEERGDAHQGPRQGNDQGDAEGKTDPLEDHRQAR